MNNSEYYPPSLGKSIWHMLTFNFAHAYNQVIYIKSAVDKFLQIPLLKSVSKPDLCDSCTLRQKAEI